jgi:sphingosine kinase
MLIRTRTAHNNNNKVYRMTTTSTTSRDGSSLDTPLLQSVYSPNMASSTLSPTIEWPTESAERVKLIIPSEWNSDSVHGILRWDAARRLVLVVSVDEPDHVLDAIDPDDMIGVDWQVQLSCTTGTPEQVRATSEGRSATNEPLSEIAEDTQGSAVLTMYSYPRKDPSQSTWSNWCGITSFTPKPNPSYQRPADPSKLGDRYAHHRHFTLAPAEDLQDCNALLTALRHLSTPSSAASTTTTDKSSSPKKYLIVVNPRSGPKRNAAVLCEEKVQPMLEQAGIQCDVCVTKHAHHAEERMLAVTATATSTAGPLETDVSEYDGLILMGGDGVIHEALNGIMARPDSAAVLQKLKVGVVGCGTSNGFATSLMLESKERYGVTNETFLICKGKSAWTDLSRYTLTDDKSYISFLTYSWAMIANIDIESEVIHFMGESRFDIWAVWRCIFLRRYRARFSYLPASKVPDKTKAIDHMPALAEAVPADWVTVEDNFLLFWASHVSHASMHAHHSPRSHWQDHILQILTVRGDFISRYRMVRILLGLETGSHVDMPGVEFVECVAYRLEHFTAGSFNDIDGEKVEDGPIQAHVLPGAFQVFCNLPPAAAAAAGVV